ncbi:YjcQ family protein [Alkalicoccobacillus gibsonii]|uniref:YjcQ family protein n=1 Tax=Alkalicoccobacillus gibsonii TaxID=79881 RepID=UPI003F7C4B08
MRFDRRKLRYAVLKEIDRGNLDSITQEALGLSKSDHMGFIEELQNDDYIRGAEFYQTGAYLKDARLSLAGEEYVHDNNEWVKAYNAIKEIKEFITP